MRFARAPGEDLRLFDPSYPAEGKIDMSAFDHRSGRGEGGADLAKSTVRRTSVVVDVTQSLNDFGQLPRKGGRISRSAPALCGFY